MKKIVAYLKEYTILVDKRVFFLCSLFTAVLIFLNYFFGANRSISRLGTYGQYASWYGVFLFAFAGGYAIHAYFGRYSFFSRRPFLLLLLLAPAIFAWKMAYRFPFTYGTGFLEKEYWNAVLYWPFKVLVITLALFIVHRIFDKEEPFYGVTTNNFSLRPYLWMLVLMVPLLAIASTQKDFLQMYPRMQKVAYLLLPGKGWEQLLYQLSYGTDFFSIELFFRGFLVLAFARYAGRDAILPMAIFYCTIHFGKPLGECISSYFGGIILGVVSFHTRSILGGFLVHVGIAWLMELGGYLGSSFSS